MQKFVGSNVEQSRRSLLRNNRLVEKERTASLKLLIAEEDQFARDLEQLERAFDRVGNGKAHITKIKRLRNRLDQGSEARKRTEQLLATMEQTQRLLEVSYESLRRRQSAEQLQRSFSATERRRSYSCR